MSNPSILMFSCLDIIGRLDVSIDDDTFKSSKQRWFPHLTNNKTTAYHYLSSLIGLMAPTSKNH